MLRRYRTLNNDTEVNVDGARLRAGDDGVFVVEAGSREEDVLIAGGAISAHLFSLLFDDEGNLIANVNHRTGALAALLALDGGDGEISVATDFPVIVRHNGVAGEAKAFYASGLIHSAFCSGTATSANTGAATQLAFDQGIIDPFGIVDVANNRLNVPRDGVLVYAEVTVLVAFTGLTGGTYRRIWLERDVSGFDAWTLCSGYVERPAMSSDLSLSVTGLIEPAAIGTGTRVRVMAQHDDVVARSPAITLLSAKVFKA